MNNLPHRRLKTSKLICKSELPQTQKRKDEDII